MDYVNSIPQYHLAADDYLFNVIENGEQISMPVMLRTERGSLKIKNSELTRLHIPYKPSKEGYIYLAEIKHLKFTVDYKNSLLKITVPETWLPVNKLTLKDSWTQGFYSTSVTPGMFLDYNLYNENHTGERYSSAWLDANYFNHYSYLNISGRYFRTQEGKSDFQRFIRESTSWVLSDRKNSRNIVIGDMQSTSNNGFDGVYMGGVQFKSNFSLRPDVVTYPSISLQGTAATPSTLDFFVNGYRKTEQKVGSGPYVINDIPFINGNGTMTVVTNNSTGQKVSTTIPFNVKTDMLKPGWNDYNLSTGWLRYNYGLANSEYKDFAVNGYWRRGLINWLTLVTHAEEASGLQDGALGGQFNLGEYGSLDAIYQISHDRKGSASKSYIGYSKDFGFGSVSMSHINSVSGFRDLASYDYDADFHAITDQVFYSQSLGDRYGYLGMGLIHQNFDHIDEHNILNVSYSNVFFNDLSITFSFSHEASSRKNDVFMVGFSLPLGSNTVISQQNQFTEYGGNYTTSVSHNSNNKTGIDWSGSITRSPQLQGRSLYKNFSSDWKGDKFTAGGGFYGEDQMSYWESLSGSVVFMNNSISFARQTGDSFVKVDTNGISGVHYFANGVEQGVTDSNGYGFISDLLPYQDNSVTISPESLPSDVLSENTSERVFLPSHAGYNVYFDLKKADSLVNLRLKLSSGINPPVGSIMYDAAGNDIGLVGYSGLVQIKDQSSGDTIYVRKNTMPECSFIIPKSRYSGVEDVLCIKAK
ncbi:hypothetical protein PRCB_02490 [Pantoea rodasii]|uniref:Fimbrial biogenesis outer membrane usher protein n=1 Tax=Pantoea rodasii TaxID=1076549 RepID=A0A2M9WHY6_9GAMM|nr:fimbria/pilus outer membrane usher protein [Pantoea rodasii]ORM60445.1 hypothetical protein HA45_21805 [Pantoea rodasii]PJZ07151.1 hypothetical protein PRCB_02490 [Pantoea rodasii]